jgi:aryl-alcohol dehydrogenase-like predicted oxidoreductase
LASGLLTGKYPRTGDYAEGTRFAAMPVFTQGLTEATFDTVDRLSALADKLGHSLLELSVGWLLAQPGVSSVLVGATRPEQVAQNAAAADWHLSKTETAEVEAALAG